MIDIICHGKPMTKLVTEPDYPNRLCFLCRKCRNSFQTSNPERLEWAIGKFTEHGLTEVTITALRKAYTRFWIAARKAGAL